MIDEKKLIEELNKYARENFHLNDEFEWVLEGMIKALDIVERQPKVGEWIPCSERLPLEDGWYLETVVCGKTKRTGFGLFKKGIWEHFDDEIETIAWMPLPAPYNADMRKKVE